MFKIDIQFFFFFWVKIDIELISTQVGSQPNRIQTNLPCLGKQHEYISDILDETMTVEYSTVHVT